MSTVYLNGAYLPLESAKVSVLDRGFVFGDGVYEVIPAYAGRLFRLAEHLARLENSLTAIRLKNPYTTSEWQNIFKDLLKRHGRGDQAIYVQVTRGAPAKRDHAFPKQTPPTVFVMSTPFTVPSTYTGANAITHPDERWSHCHIKAITLLANVLARQAATEAGAAEAILLKEGLLTEGSSSNIFIVEQGVIKTPPKSRLILPGITRDVVLELLAKESIAFEECDITESQLRKADEVWFCSSTREVVPIISLDGVPVSTGEVGEQWQRIWSLYQIYKHSF